MRNWKLDNMKGILIILVVVGHLLELNLQNNSNRMLYFGIYLFHMAAFSFTTGYFAKFRPKKMLCKIVAPYLIFQIIYTLFVRIVLEQPLSFSVKTPYWMLWYLMAMMFWFCMIPIIDQKTNKEKLGILICSVLLALGVGFLPYIGRTYSISRMLVYFPFFISGFYAKNAQFSKRMMQPTMQRGLGLLFIAVLGLTSFVVIFQKRISNNALYEANAYQIGGYTIWFRLTHIIIGFLMTAALFLGIPNKKLSIITFLGQHTMVIFLLHGFFVLLLKE
ncbi:MAG: acyltransferase family protein [Lachnospiraceae bacterium]|nr:acyltransferase family protein [Lachnospiraceae bacterium]